MEHTFVRFTVKIKTPKQHIPPVYNDEATCNAL